jgi:hypothetical protein
MPQTATAMNTVEGLIEVSTNGTSWTNISGSSNKIDSPVQTADANGNKAPGRISELPLPGVDAETPGPTLLTFKLQATQMAKEHNAPSPSASLSPSASPSA